jgi:hypothetical protein
VSTKAKVYLVIPNAGDIISPMIKPIFDMATDRRFEVLLCDLVKSNRRGVNYNKNMTVKEFLNTDCQWYVSIDSDQVPYKNPFDLILADRDIIGLPTPISDSKWIIWNIFMESKVKLGRYSPLRLDRKMLDNNEYPDLIECHGVGGGAIVVKREVFEKVYPPFLDEIDSDGQMRTEHDLEFCRKAREKGFHVFFSPYYRCEHFKKMPILSMLSANNHLFMTSSEETQNG